MYSENNFHVLFMQQDLMMNVSQRGKFRAKEVSLKDFVVTRRE